MVLLFLFSTVLPSFRNLSEINFLYILPTSVSRQSSLCNSVLFVERISKSCSSFSATWILSMFSQIIIVPCSKFLENSIGGSFGNGFGTNFPCLIESKSKKVCIHFPPLTLENASICLATLIPLNVAPTPYFPIPSLNAFFSLSPKIK